jgi:hypothetical protein
MHISLTRFILPTLGLLTSLSIPAMAAQMTLVYTDTFTSADALYVASGSRTYFSGNTPFQVTAVFDNATPSFSLPGFNTYTPIRATLTVGGQSYTLLDADVSIFDRSNPFSPGLYAVGFIQNPAQDQAGFVQDYSSATPDFTVNHLIATTFTGYNGTGFQPGSAPPPGCQMTNTCTGHNDTPLHLVSLTTGAQYLLSPGDRDSGNTPAGTATLIFTPEPGTISFVLAGGAVLSRACGCASNQ